MKRCVPTCLARGEANGVRRNRCIVVGGIRPDRVAALAVAITIASLSRKKRRAMR